MTVAHRLAARYGFDELVWNHISSRVTDVPSDFLITPGDRHFAMMRPDDFVWARSGALKNVTAAVIHGAIFDARPDVGAVVHAHSRAVVFVSNLPKDDTLKFYTQDGGGFYGKVAYHDFEGVANDYEEQENIRRDLGDKHTLIMRHHGAATTGKTVGEAWVRMYYLDRVCQAQMDIYHAGLRNSARPVDESILEDMSKVYENPAFEHGMEWDAMASYCDEYLME